MATYCENHPGQVAKWRCYRCKKPLCSRCRLLLSGHFFCSQKCRYLYLLSVLLKRVKTRSRAVPKYLTPQVVLNGLLTLGLIIGLFLILSLKREMRSLRVQHPLAGKEPVPEDTLTVLQPVTGAMVYFNIIDIEGEANEGRIIALSLNDKLVDVTLPRNGRFSFKDVKIKRGDNLLTVKSISENGKVLTLERIRIHYTSPTIRYLARNITRGDLSEKKVALTFDGGSEANITPEILDILKQEGVRCTMFLTGTFIKKYPELVKRMVAEGHEVANHTYSHPHLTTFTKNRRHQTLKGVTREFIQAELRRTEELFRKVTGKAMAPYWRAPYGEHNLQIRTWAAEIGYQQVGWTVGKRWEDNMDTLDWVVDESDPRYRSAEEIKDKIINFGKGKKEGANGCIILMHLASFRQNDFPHRKLPEIIKGLRDRGYQFVKVSELLR